MKDVCAIEALIDLPSRDPFDVLCAPQTGDRSGQPFPAALPPKGSFELAWDLAH